MFMIIHALLGIIIASNFHSKILILILGILSHYLLDMIPHWDGDFDREDFKKTGIPKVVKTTVVLHTINYLFIFWLIYSLAEVPHGGLLILGVVAAILPDIANLVYPTRLKNNKKYISHLKFHARIQTDSSRTFGIIIQIILALIFIHFLPAGIF